MDSELWCVVQDGRPHHRGLSRSEAERLAAYLAKGYEGHRASDKRRVAEFEIKRDHALHAEHDANYKWLKENL